MLNFQVLIFKTSKKAIYSVNNHQKCSNIEPNFLFSTVKQKLKICLVGAWLYLNDVGEIT